MSQSFDKSTNAPRFGLSRIEVAAAVGVSPSSVDVMVGEGALPKPRSWHTRKIWLSEEIQAYMRGWPVDGEQGGSDAEWEASTV